MPSPSAALVIFDLGGTTIRDRGEVPAAFSAALAVSGIRFDPAEIDLWRGASKRGVLRRLVDRQLAHEPASVRDARAAEAFERFVTALRQRLEPLTDLALPGAATAFQRLKDAGLKIALNTGFDRSVLDVVLHRTGWADGVFDSIVCGDDVEEGRPSPLMIFRSMKDTGVARPALVAVVGDTRLDLEAGANAGAGWRIGVLTGAHDRVALERSPHTHIVRSVEEVPGVVLDERSKK